MGDNFRFLENIQIKENTGTKLVQFCSLVLTPLVAF